MHACELTELTLDWELKTLQYMGVAVFAEMRSIFVFAIIVGVVCDAAFQIVVTKNKSKRPKLMEAGSRSSYQRNENESKLTLNNKATAEVPVYDLDDVEYLANITIGNPPQEFVILLDTGSSDLLVPDSTCSECADAEKDIYYPNLSSTYRNDGQSWDIRYGDGTNATGITAIDTVCFGGIDQEQLCVPNTVFGRATQMGGFENDVSDGVLGLGFQSLSVTNSVPPLINAINQNLLSQPIFTVFLMKVGPNIADPGGIFTFGDLDTTNCGPIIAYEPLTSATYWQFKLVSVASGSYSNNGGEAISDTGTSFIYGPENDIDGLASAVGAQYDSVNNSYTINCDATPSDVIFTIGANKYSVNYRNYIVEGAYGECEFAFKRNDIDTGVSWLLGDAFIRSYCNTYDYGNQRIGFSAAIGVMPTSSPSPSPSPVNPNPATACPTGQVRANKKCVDPGPVGPLMHLAP